MKISAFLPKLLVSRSLAHSLLHLVAGEKHLLVGVMDFFPVLVPVMKGNLAESSPDGHSCLQKHTHLVKNHRIIENHLLFPMFLLFFQFPVVLSVEVPESHRQQKKAHSKW